MLLNEVNTMPGFTDISMYPKLKIAAGQNYGQLLEELVGLALQRAGRPAHVNAAAQNAIGVFDSGLGGLTAVRELRRIPPGEDIVYFGDTGACALWHARAGYHCGICKAGHRLLLSKGVKAVIAACGMVSSTLPAEVAASLPVPYMGGWKRGAGRRAGHQNGAHRRHWHACHCNSGSYPRPSAASCRAPPLRPRPARCSCRLWKTAISGCRTPLPAWWRRII